MRVTTVNESPSPDAAGTAGPSRARVARPWLVAGAYCLVAATMVLGVLPALVVVPVLGALAAGAAAPSRGVSSRAVTWSRRTAAAAAGMGVGGAVLVGVPMAMGLLLPNLPLEVVQALSAARWVVVAAALALPFAMSQSTRDTADAGRSVITRRNLVLAVASAIVVLDAHFNGRSFVVLLNVAVFVPIVLAVQRLSAARGGGVRVRLGQALNEIVFWALLAAATLVGTFDLLGTLGSLPVTATSLRTAVLVMCAVGALVSLIPGRRLLAATNVMAIAGSAFLASQLVGIYHGPVDAVSLAAPVRGQWFVGQGGRAALVNGHRAAFVQDDALDIAKVVDGQSYRGDASRLESYYCYGEPVLAPAAGRVVNVEADMPDQRIGSMDAQNPAGNHVVIDIGGGRYSGLAHLRPGSVAVRVGDTVRQGQQIGEVGNSGNTTEPHLHMQIQNFPGYDVITPPVGARTYPWLLPDVTVTRLGHSSRPDAADLRRGDYFAS